MAVPMGTLFLNGSFDEWRSSAAYLTNIAYGQLRLMALQQSNISGGQFMFSDFLWVLALCLGTYLWFRRSDLK